MIEINTIDRELEEALFNTLQEVINKFDEHFNVKTSISRKDFDINKVDKYFWGEKDKDELWQNILNLIKSPKIKNQLLESGAFLRRFSREQLEVSLITDKHFSKLITTWDVKERILKAIEQITGIVPSLGVTFHLSLAAINEEDKTNPY